MSSPDHKETNAEAEITDVTHNNPVGAGPGDPTSNRTSEEGPRVVLSNTEWANIQEQLRKLSMMDTFMAMQAQQPTTVIAQAPLPLPKLKTFTGLEPTSPQEVNFREWYLSISSTIEDKAILNKSSFVCRHLKGPALAHVADLKDGDHVAILNRLQELFGELKSPDDLYMDLVQMRPQPGQLLSDHLLRISEKMEEIQKTAKYEAGEFKRKLYKAFSCGIPQTKGLVALEIRNKFGMPGCAEPEFMALFRFLRQIEALEPPKSRKETTTTAMPTTVTEAEDTPSRQRQRFKGHCYKCGLDGHAYKTCRSAPNPALVNQRARESKERQNQWRKAKGLPTLN